MKLFITIILLAMLTLSCTSLKKRIYTKGFYTSHKTIKKSQTSFVNRSIYLPVIKNGKDEKDKFSYWYAQNDKLIPVLKNYFIDLPCDSIILKNGIVELAQKTKIKHKLVYFKRCDDFSNRTIRVNKNEVSYIRFSNGKKEFEKFKEETPPKKKPEDLATLGLILTIAGYASFIFLAFSMNSLAIGFAVLGTLLFLTGLLLCIISLKHKNYAKNPRLVKALSIADFILSLPGALAIIVSLFILFLSLIMLL